MDLENAKDIGWLMDTFKLGYQQALFVSEYVVLKNATQAAINSGYSPNTASEMGYENLRKPHIKAAVDSILGTVVKRKIMDLEDCVQTLSDISDFDVADLYAEDGERLLNIHDIPKHARKAIQKIKFSTIRDKKGVIVDEIREIQTESKLGAIDKLMKHHGGYKESQQYEFKLTPETMLNLTRQMRQEDDDDEA